jgi:DsbC/DsbD-like thiol-disulfide interchange protein
MLTHRIRTPHVLILLLLGLGILVSSALASAAAPRDPRVHVELVSEVASIRPGEPFWIALRQRIAPDWHTFWVNPGDSGEPTRLDWTLAPGVSADAISWPPPQRIPVGPAMSYGYTEEVLLPIRMVPPATSARVTRWPCGPRRPGSSARRNASPRKPRSR